MNIIAHGLIFLSIIMIVVALLLTLLRLLIGPSLPDRVMAFDLFSILIMCLIGIYSLINMNSLYLDIVLALALMAFLGTIAFSQFIEWQLSKDNHD